MPFDGLAIAKALAAELKDGGYDLILFGSMAIDTANGTVGPMTAELLGLPCVTRGRRSSSVADGAGHGARASSRAPRRSLSSRCPPWSPSTRASRGRGYPSLKGIMAAKKKPLESQARALGRGRADRRRRWSFPPERAAGRIIGEGAAAVPELVRLLQTEAKVL